MREAELKDVGYIYIIEVRVPYANDIRLGKWYKIGKTKSPVSRLRDYNSSFPFDVYEYSFLSEKIFNLSRVEEMIIAEIRGKKTFTFSETRREWFTRRKRSNTTEVTLSVLGNMINKYVDKYYEGE